MAAGGSSRKLGEIVDSVADIEGVLVKAVDFDHSIDDDDTSDLATAEITVEYSGYIDPAADTDMEDN